MGYARENKLSKCEGAQPQRCETRAASTKSDPKLARLAAGSFIERAASTVDFGFVRALFALHAGRSHRPRYLVAHCREARSLSMTGRPPPEGSDARRRR
jgi:hypothetical protein